jgi:hypothetical protein
VNAHRRWEDVDHDSDQVDDSVAGTLMSPTGSTEGDGVPWTCQVGYLLLHLYSCASRGSVKNFKSDMESRGYIT